jgi:uncharacterized protein YndB with AHSA1/START domain
LKQILLAPRIPVELVPADSIPPEESRSMRALKALGILCLLIACLMTAVLVLGAMQPRAHIASASIVLAAPQSRVWAMIEDTATQPQWRKDLTAVQQLPEQDGHLCWLEVQKYGKMPLCETLTVVPSKRVVLIADPKLPFGGTWTYDLAPAGADSTTLTITENGFTGPLFWRFMGHYVFHEDTMIKEYEASLQKAIAQP